SQFCVAPAASEEHPGQLSSVVADFEPVDAAVRTDPGQIPATEERILVCGERRGGRCDRDRSGQSNMKIGMTAHVILPYPRPMNGIFVAMTVMNCTFASSG